MIRLVWQLLMIMMRASLLDDDDDDDDGDDDDDAHDAYGYDKAADDDTADNGAAADYDVNSDDCPEYGEDYTDGHGHDSIVMLQLARSVMTILRMMSVSIRLMMRLMVMMMPLVLLMMVILANTAATTVTNTITLSLGSVSGECCVDDDADKVHDNTLDSHAISDNTGYAYFTG